MSPDAEAWLRWQLAQLKPHGDERRPSLLARLLPHTAAEFEMLCLLAQRAQARALAEGAPWPSLEQEVGPLGDEEDEEDEHEEGEE